jgi:hypothetical protein
MALEKIIRRGYAQTDRNEVEELVADLVEQNPEPFIAKYIADPRSFAGRYVAADLFKETFPQYAKSKDSRNRYNTPVHNSAAVLAAEQFRRMLLSSSSSSKRDVVVFLTGIPGAGKTSSILSGGEFPEHYRMVFEGQLSNLQTTKEKIMLVLAAGLRPTILVVHALPENALENTITRYYEEGRGASINVMSEIQGKLPDTLAQIRDLFSKEVDLIVQDVRNRKDQKTHFGWDNLSIIASEGNHETIKHRLRIAVESLNSFGILSDACYQQAIGGVPTGRDQEMAGDYQRKYDAHVRGRRVSQGNCEESIVTEEEQTSSCDVCNCIPCICPNGSSEEWLPKPA